MITIALSRLKRRPLWQVGVALLAIYLAAFGAIFGSIRLLASIGPLLSIAGASFVLAWAFLGIARLRHDDDWHGDEWIGS
jgi:hypothetical protein